MQQTTMSGWSLSSPLNGEVKLFNVDRITSPVTKERKANLDGPVQWHFGINSCLAEFEPTPFNPKCTVYFSPVGSWISFGNKLGRIRARSWDDQLQFESYLNMQPCHQAQRSPKILKGVCIEVLLGSTSIRISSPVIGQQHKALITLCVFFFFLCPCFGRIIILQNVPSMKGLCSCPPTHIRVIHLPRVSGGHEHEPSASRENQNSKEATNSSSDPSVLILTRANVCCRRCKLSKYLLSSVQKSRIIFHIYFGRRNSRLG